MKALFILAALLAHSAEQEPLICGFQEKADCQPGAMCRTADASRMMTTLNFEKHTYQRCDDKGCDTYQVVASGDFEKYRTFELPGRGAFVKLSPDNHITEVVSLGHMVLVSQGMCFSKSEIDREK